MRQTCGLITLTSDFEKQSQGIALMHASIFKIAPHARVIDLMHGLPSFGICAAARTMESIAHTPVGQHVCVCDPGVGSARKAIICQVDRGDYLIGPDNGVLLPASLMLGGIKSVYQITNTKYMNEIISPIFHGRDIFSPVAAHLTNGVTIDNFGPEIDPSDLIKAPYDEASQYNCYINATIIQVNKFGSIHLNIRHLDWDKLQLSLGSIISVRLPDGCKFEVPYGRTFSDVKVGHSVLLKDDYGRIEIATNQGDFAKQNQLVVGDDVCIYLN